MQSQKYAGWEIEKCSVGLGVGYEMTRPDWAAQGVMYAVVVTQTGAGEWVGESVVWSDRLGEWVANQTSATGPVPAVVEVIERRAAYWLAKRLQ